ncbi:MAG: phosphoribosylamine--glycine ligase [Bacteroidetes bacterium]|nr:phosphoribosylamine--glycine ligase [Bacteroidota bacterium]
MKILIIGNGGREHAIGIKLKQDNADVELFFAKGNGGTEELGTNVNIDTTIDIVDFAKNSNIDITIVGSEALLVDGIVDEFTKNDLKIFGPHQAAAMLEGDKAFAKSFMNKFNVRTAIHKSFINSAEAIDFVATQQFPIVIKATGLAAGKGVIIAQNLAEATKTIQQILDEKIFGAAGNEVVIEEFLNGFEVSVLSVFNGKNIYPLISAKDHKKIFDGDKGANTGGMGSIAPHPFYTQEIEQDFIDNILQPTLLGIIAEGLQFAGVIFFGLMIVNNKCYLLEYNLRMGDPETQAVLPLMQSNFIEVINDAIDGKELNLQWKNESSSCVVVASKGYPNEYEVNKLINGISQIKNNVVLAGAKYIDGKYYTNGGRVLNVVCKANTLTEAIDKCYKTIENIEFDGMYYRKDIGKM